jgi:hypothetical protein
MANWYMTASKNLEPMEESGLKRERHRVFDTNPLYPTHRRVDRIRRGYMVRSPA